VFFQGTFGRIFRALPAAEFSDRHLSELARAMTAEREDEPTPETQIDPEENQGIDAGYTYLGQFIDHDLTFDPMSSLLKLNDPDALTDFRTPRFDLDSLYGRGPDDQPYLYEDDGLRFKLGNPLAGSDFDPNVRDLPRHGLDGQRKRALIGDPRNDENVIVAQLHATMLRFHNRVVQHLTRGTRKPNFTEVQRVVRWHYQWVVLHDFLPTIAGKEAVHRVLPHLEKGRSIYVRKPDLRFFKWRHEPFMPVEFSVAAFRFGHSMVRPIYRLNTNLLGKGKGDPVNGRKFILTPNDNAQGLNGFREIPRAWAIDWSLFFDMGNDPPKIGVNRLQKSYKIDASLVNSLGTLPRSVARGVLSLAERNLKRGVSMALPSGQAVARAMDIEPIQDDELRVGKATRENSSKNKSLTEISPAFADNAPLWYYVLAEAQQQFRRDDTPIRLGPVGGRIVTEVFVGLLLGDSHSFLSQAPSWKPDPAFTTKGKFGVADLISQAIRA
jgi:hypothetical protein